MQDNQNVENPTELSINELKSKALLYGLTFKGNISKEALKAMIDEALKTKTENVGIYEAEDDESDYIEGADDFQAKRVTRGQVREIKDQALLMMKVRITNLNPEESDADNVYAGVVTNYVRAARYIPFNRVWYVEQCLVDKLMIDKQQVFVNDIDPNTRRPNGNKKAKLVKHYNVEFVR